MEEKLQNERNRNRMKDDDEEEESNTEISTEEPLQTTLGSMDDPSTVSWWLTNAW